MSKLYEVSVVIVAVDAANNIYDEKDVIHCGDYTTLRRARYIQDLAVTAAKHEE